MHRRSIAGSARLRRGHEDIYCAICDEYHFHFIRQTQCDGVVEVACVLLHIIRMHYTASGQENLAPERRENWKIGKEQRARAHRRRCCSVSYAPNAVYYAFYYDVYYMFFMGPAAKLRHLLRLQNS